MNPPDYIIDETLSRADRQTQERRYKVTLDYRIGRAGKALDDGGSSPWHIPAHAAEIL